MTSVFHHTFLRKVRPKFALWGYRCHNFSTEQKLNLSNYDTDQLSMMREACILCDMEDNIIDQASKKEVHMIDGLCMRYGGMPHRAFSVFLFNEEWELLIQKRSKKKILFPLHWANTCCSHPLAHGATFLGNKIYDEDKGWKGTIQAARRKIEQELGISQRVLPNSDFHFVTKVHYKAPLPGDDPLWGEHEIDYILLIQHSQADIEAALELNPNEVVDVKWISQQACRDFVANGIHQSSEELETPKDELISPWFAAIERDLLHGWWDQLKSGESIIRDDQIHRLKGGREAIYEYHNQRSN